MLRVLAWIAAGVIAVIAAAVLALVLFRTEVTAYYLNPGVGFEQSARPPAPDYETPAAWAAKPGRADEADLAPPGMAPPVSDGEARADVFFVHPTTYYSSEGWNGPIDDEDSLEIVHMAVMATQASAFNLAGRIYAPYYRQATLYAFLEPWDELEDPESTKALELAYSDVARAFETYIRLFNNGRPFILAGHSQGSLHLIRLMQDYLTDPDLKSRLIAAYPVGMSVPLTMFDGPGAPLAHVPPCENAAQTGCLVSWNTFGPEGDPEVWFEQQRVWEHGDLRPVAGRDLNCTNPLSWQRGGGAVGGPMQRYALPFRGWGEDAPVTRLPDPLELELSAACRNGILYLDRQPPDGLNELVFDNADYHIYDYNLFYGSIRENAALRVAAYAALR